MSYDITEKIVAGRNARDLAAVHGLNDEKRHEFLMKLAASNAPLSDWEHKFTCDTCGLTRFSDRQRFIVDNLMKKYSVHLPLPPSARRTRPKKKFVSREQAMELFKSHLRKEHLTVPPSEGEKI